jgi:CO dehydrogenase/acetyl-CoA synthase gamma subunit (corrinoid Fe-S protein)
MPRLRKRTLLPCRAWKKIKGEKEELGREKIAELIANPLSFLWFGIIQNDTSWWNGKILDDLNESSKVNNTTIIQPVMSMQVTGKVEDDFSPGHPHKQFPHDRGF